MTDLDAFMSRLSPDMCVVTAAAGATAGITPARRLPEWAKRIRSWKKQGCDVFVYFDNNQKSAAPADALLSPPKSGTSAR